MDRIVAVSAVMLALAAGVWFQYRLSRGRMWTPLWLSFSATAAAILFAVSGVIGYNLSRHSAFVNGTAWSGGVIWWEVGIGVALAFIAAPLWRAGVRSLRTR